MSAEIIELNRSCNTLAREGVTAAPRKKRRPRKHAGSARRRRNAHSFDHQAFGKRLRAVRLALGLSEVEAARAAGRSVATWRRYEETGDGYITGPILLFVNRSGFGPGWLNWLLTGEGPAPFRSGAGVAAFIKSTPAGFLPAVAADGTLVRVSAACRDNFSGLRLLPRLLD